MSDLSKLVEDYLAAGPYAVVGASTDRSKYGNRVLRAYIEQGREVYPVNPRAETVEGLRAWPDLESVPADIRGISVITPPQVTSQVVEAAARKGVELVWMQPGAESDSAVARARELGLRVIAGGPCFLVASRALDTPRQGS